MPIRETCNSFGVDFFYIKTQQDETMKQNEGNSIPQSAALTAGKMFSTDKTERFAVLFSWRQQSILQT